MNRILNRVISLCTIYVCFWSQSASAMSKYKEAHVNNYEAYISPVGSSFISNNSIVETVVDTYTTAISTLMSKLEKELPRLESSSDTSIYTGSTGVALLYFFLAKKTQNKEFLVWPQNLLSNMFKVLKGRRECFLNGDGGPLALGAILFKGQNPELSKQFLSELIALHTKVISRSADMPDELLYGRAGYLYALLFVNKHMGNDTVSADVIRKVVLSILDSGQSLAQENSNQGPPLQYEWHGKNYFGAAHGVAGILYVLLQAKDMLTSAELQNLVVPTINDLLSHQFKSGNFPSSKGNDKDRLVQWCHGAPGFVQLFSKAYQILGDEKYLKAALDCGEVVWKRGILRKGYSICHGIAGNGYTFLQLYQLTGDLKQLHRAACFGDLCSTNWPHDQDHPPDRPFSLFEGIAGIIYFLTDLKHPEEAAFPAYTL